MDDQMPTHGTQMEISVLALGVAYDAPGVYLALARTSVINHGLFKLMVPFAATENVTFPVHRDPSLYIPHHIG
jgi:hypothetical protein